jgi:hypothetical protein
MTPQTFTFASSSFWPIAIGFFGLGTGYFIWGGQALFGYPKAGPEIDRTIFDLGSQDAVLCGQIFVPQKKFVVYGSGDVSKHASPNHSRASLNLIVEPGLYMLLGFQKAAVRGNYETGK